MCTKLQLRIVRSIQIREDVGKLLEKVGKMHYNIIRTLCLKLTAQWKGVLINEYKT